MVTHMQTDDVTWNTAENKFVDVKSYPPSARVNVNEDTVAALVGTTEFFLNMKNTTTIAEQYLKMVNENFQTVEGFPKEIKIPANYNKELIYTFTDCKPISTNDIIAFAHISFHTRILSIGVIVLQILLYCIIISANSTIDGVVPKTFEMIIVRLFISFYLAVVITDNMSDTFVNWLSGNFVDGNLGTNICMFLWLPFYVAFLVFYISSLSFFLLLTGNFNGVSADAILLFWEILILFVGTFATAIVTKIQGDIMSTIFNFLGILFILQLDELLCKYVIDTVGVQFRTLILENKDLFVEPVTQKGKFYFKLSSGIYIFVGLTAYLMTEYKKP
jgi:hypothetical protein